jgi:hypothetical protein
MKQGNEIRMGKRLGAVVFKKRYLRKGFTKLFYPTNGDGGSYFNMEFS